MSDPIQLPGDQSVAAHISASGLLTPHPDTPIGTEPRTDGKTTTRDPRDTLIMQSNLYDFLHRYGRPRNC